MKKILCLLGALLALNLCGCSQEEVDLVVDAAYSLLAEETAADIDDDADDVILPIEENTPAEIPAEPEKEADKPAAVPEKAPEADPEEVPVVEPEKIPAPEAVPEEDPAPQTDPQEVAYGEYYYDVENVVLYLDTYGELPENYITKNEARDLGWNGGSVENYQDGAAIGGDRFGNREGLLPDGSWVECDIDTEDENSRGAKRLVFNLDDGLYYFTDDHYESFVEVVVDENGEVIYK